MVMETNNTQTFSRKDYMLEFKNRIKDKAFKYDGQTFYCTDAKVQNDKFIIYTDKRTFVLVFSQLENISILASVEPKKILNVDLIQAVKLDSNETKYPSNRTLSFEKIKYFYDKYHDYNLEKGGAFTIEEDELIKMITPSEASEILGRTPIAISARKNYVKRTKGDKFEFNVYSSSTKIETTNSILGDDEKTKQAIEDQGSKTIVDKLVKACSKIDEPNDVIKTIETSKVEEPKIEIKLVLKEQDMDNNIVKKAPSITFNPRQELFILMNQDQVCIEMFGGQYTADDISFHRMSLISKIQENNPSIFI